LIRRLGGETMAAVPPSFLRELRLPFFVHLLLGWWKIRYILQPGSLRFPGRILIAVNVWLWWKTALIVLKREIKERVGGIFGVRGKKKPATQGVAFRRSVRK